MPRKPPVFTKPRKRRDYFDAGRESRRKTKVEIQYKLDDLNEFLKNSGLQFQSVVIVKKNIEFNEDYELNLLGKRFASRSQNSQVLVMKALQAVDGANMSQRNYIGFKKQMSISCMPSLNILTTFKKRLNQFFDLKKNEYGNFVDCKQKIEYVLKKIFTKHSNVVKNDTFSLKFSGDGTNITKSSVQLLNFTFTVLNDQERCKTSIGNYILGMFEINGENYEQLKGCLGEILEELKGINSINIDGKVYAIKHFFAGDLKFLATVYGINPANSDFPCLWCKCNLREIFKTDAVWPISRTYAEACERYKLKTKNEKQGYVREPLVDFIDFDHALIDTLHLLLRITDKLYDCLFRKFDKTDNKDSTNLEKRPLLKKFLNYLQKDCGITNPWYLSQGVKIKLRSLSGADRLKFLKVSFENDQDRLVTIFPELDMKNENFVFKEFYELFNIIKLYGNPYRIDLTVLKDRLRSWLSVYLMLNDNDINLTPYVHAFVFHMPEFLEKYQNINQFNMQGLEKLNDMATKYYHLSTNKHKVENGYLLQLIAKRNRIEFFSLDGQLDEVDQKLGTQIGLNLQVPLNLNANRDREEVKVFESESVECSTTNLVAFSPKELEALEIIEQIEKSLLLGNTESKSEPNDILPGSTCEIQVFESTKNKNEDEYERNPKKIKTSEETQPQDYEDYFESEPKTSSCALQEFTTDISQKIDITANATTVVATEDVKVKMSFEQFFNTKVNIILQKKDKKFLGKKD